MMYTVQIQLNDVISVTISRESGGKVGYFLNLRVEEQPIHDAMPVVEGESLLLGSLRDILGTGPSLIQKMSDGEILPPRAQEYRELSPDTSALQPLLDLPSTWKQALGEQEGDEQ